LQDVLELNEEERDLLVAELLDTGLAQLLPYNFLRFDPVLCPYLLQELDEQALAESQAPVWQVCSS